MNKYRACPTIVDGIRFASKREAARYGMLVILQKQGLIADLVLQPAYPLEVNGIPVGKYVGDFRYRNTTTGETILEDAKGIRTPVYRLKKKLVWAIYGIEIQEV